MVYCPSFIAPVGNTVQNDRNKKATQCSQVSNDVYGHLKSADMAPHKYREKYLCSGAILYLSFFVS